MKTRFIYSVLLVVLSAMWVQASSAATIFRCKQANGSFVYQQRACADNEVSGDSQAHRTWKKMRKLTAEGQSIIRVLGPDVESIKRCKSSMRRFNAKLDSVDRMLKGLRADANTKYLLGKSQTYLRDCGICRSSAESACQQASKYLDETTQHLMKVK